MTASRLWTATAGFAALLAAPHLALWALESGTGGDAVQLTAPAALASDWQVKSPDVSHFKPAFQNPSGEMAASYASQGRVVGLYLAYYRHQNYSQKLVSSSNVLVRSNDPQWAQVASASRSIELADKQTCVLRTAELRSASLDQSADQGRLMVWHIYWVNGILTANDYLARAYSVFYRLTGRGDDSAVIVVYTPKDQTGSAESVLESFLMGNYPRINALLRAVQQNK